MDDQDNQNDQDDQEFDLAALEEGQPPLRPRERAPGSAERTESTGPPDTSGARTHADEAPQERTPVVRDTEGAADAVEPAEAGVAEREATASVVEPVRPPVRATPAADLTGLTSAVAAQRGAEGLANVDSSRPRTNGDIIRENTLTFFNGVLGTLIVMLFIVGAVEQDFGKFQDGIFVGIVVAANVAIGTFQEIRAARTLRELVALTAPRARVVREGRESEVLSHQVVQGDLLHLMRGDQVVADGRVVAGAVEIDESLLTGESASIRKETGDEMLSGSFCTGGHCHYNAERVGMQAYAQRLTGDARERVRRDTPLQIRFRRILRVMLIATSVLGVLLLISSAVADDSLGDAITDTAATITTIVPEGLLLAMTVAFAVGAVRLSRAGAVVQDIGAVEALNYVDVVCLDKTGTITANQLVLDGVHWTREAEQDLPWLGAFTAATQEESPTARALAVKLAESTNGAHPTGNVPFSSDRRWSALELTRSATRRSFVLGAPETVLPHCGNGEELSAAQDEAAAQGLRSVVFAEAEALPDPDGGLTHLRAVALITVSDVLRPEITSAFEKMAELEIEPKIISGDNPQTVTALVRQLNLDLRGGVISGRELDALDDEAFAQAVEENSIFGRIGPQQKARIVTALRDGRHFVAMVGDGANDVRALRAADVAIAMESGTNTARGVAGIILRRDSFQAFVRGAAIAQSVLGNSSQLSKLYITKSFYAYFIIVATNFLGLEFPFLPRQGGLTAVITLGIPAIFIAVTRSPLSASENFTTNVLRFALPASLALAAATASVHLLTRGFLDRSIDDARTLVSLTIGIVGLVFMVEIVGFEGAKLRKPLRPIIVTLFGLLLLGMFMLILYTEWFRELFDFQPVDGDEWAIVIPAIIFAIAGQYVIKRYWREIIDWVIKSPKEEEISRGRAREDG